MTRAAARMLLVGLATLALYALALVLVERLPGADIRMPLPIGWTGAFAVAVVFAAWNVWDDILDARAAYRRRRGVRVIAGGLWRLRSDMLQGACCTAMAGAGALAIVQWGPPEMRTAIILSAACALVANQVWNRVDRERVMRMPATPDHAAQAAIRRLEAERATEAALKHDALQGRTADRARIQALARLLERHGVAVPPELGGA